MITKKEQLAALFLWKGLFFMMLEEVFNPVKGLRNFVNGCGIRTANVSFTAFAKGTAGDEGDMFCF